MKMFFKDHQILLFICLFGLLLRLLGLINITLTGDFAYHWQVAGDIVTKGVFPLLGPSASVNDSFHLGPFYYYLLAIPYFLGQGNFQSAIIFFSLLNTFSIFLLYYVCKQWFTVSQSLKITALYAFSSYMVSIQSFPWNPYILPFFIIVSMYCLIQIQKKHYLFVPLLFLCCSILIQGHATAIFLLPVFLFLLPIRRIPLQFYIAGIILFLISFAPWIYSDITTNFSQTKAALAIFAPGPEENCSLLHYLEHHGQGERCFSEIRNTLFMSRLFTMSLFTTLNIGVVFVMLLAIPLLLLKVSLPQKRLFVIWLGVPWLFFLLYSSNIYLHYYLILIPIPFLLLVLALEKLNKYGTWGTRINNGGFIVLNLFNIIYYILSLNTMR